MSVSKKSEENILGGEIEEEEEEEEDSDYEEEEEEEDVPKPNDESDVEEEEEDDVEEDEEDEGVDKKINPIKKVNKPMDQLNVDDFSENDYETEDESDNEDDINENNLQKFTENLNVKFLEDVHPEIKSIQYDEMIALARVVRDKTGRIVDPLHKTLPFLTKYEKARVIGARAEQLDRGGEAFVPLDESVINGRTIALLEFEAKKLPFILARPLPDGSTEYWHLRDLEIINE